MPSSAAPTPTRKVALFAGCFELFNDPASGRALVDVLAALGCEVILPDQRCCGLPAYTSGNRAAALHDIAFNVAAFAPLVDAGYDIVSGCPSCTLALREDYPGLLDSEPSRKVSRAAHDIHEYISRLLDKRLSSPCATVGSPDRALAVHPSPSTGEGGPSGPGEGVPLSFVGAVREPPGRLPFAVASSPLSLEGEGGPVPSGPVWAGPGEGVRVPHPSAALGASSSSDLSQLRLAYHAPCHLRALGCGAAPRELLERAGLKFALVNSTCCGMGGTFGLKQKNLSISNQIAADFLQRLRDARIDAVVTPCGMCKTQIAGATALRVYHPMELLAEVLKKDMIIS